MINTIQLIKKNMKILLRSKITMFVLIFGPLFIILISGMAFNNSFSYNIKVGVYSSSLSPLGQNFLEDLRNDFSVTEFPEKELCVDAVKSKGYHACIIIPENMEIKNDVTNIIEFYFDNSRVNLASSIKQSIFSSIEDTNENISQRITGNIISSIVSVETEIKNDQDLINKQIEFLKNIQTDSEKSKSLLGDSKVDFDVSVFAVDDFKNVSGVIVDDYTDLKNIHDTTLSTFDFFVDDIDSLTNTSSIQSVVDSAYEDLEDIEDSLDNSSFDGDNILILQNLVKHLENNIDTLEKKMASANTNTDKVSSSIESIKNNIEKSKDKLNSLHTSMNSILVSLGSNTVRDAEAISNPVELEEHEIVIGSKLNYLYPNLIILVLMFISIITSATQVINEKINLAKQRVDMTPVPFISHSIATFFTMLIIIFFQLALILVLSQLIFNINIFSSLLPIVVVLLLSGVFFTLLGISIGYLFNTEHSVMFGSITVSSFFFIISDLILPLESMPAKFISIMNYTPFIMATDLLRKVMFFDMTLYDVNINFFLFLGMSLVLLTLIVLTASLNSLFKKLKANHIAKKAYAKK